MKKKNVILLVVLISALIIIPTVIVIVSAGVLLTTKQDNVLNSAKEAMFKENVMRFQDELADKVSKDYTDNQGKSNTKINATGEDVKKYISSFSDIYVNKFAIVDGKLVGTDKLTATEKSWVEDLGISIIH